MLLAAAGYLAQMMKVKLVKPRSKFLRQFIQYFFFIKCEDEKYQKTHISYPNTNYCLGLHKSNKLIKSSDTSYQIFFSNDYQSYLTGIYQKPISLHYQGKFNEVCIEFEPMGLEILTEIKMSDNVFMQDAVEQAFPKSYSKLYDLAFSSRNPDLCAARLEKFFLAAIPEKNRFEFIPFNRINANQVEDLKDVYYKSYRSIHRLYRESLNISPKEFLNIQRLRRAINQLHSSHKLTRIAHDESFFDQSHMTREFKKYTHLSPKLFRKKSNLIDKTLCWTVS